MPVPAPPEKEQPAEIGGGLEPFFPVELDAAHADVDREQDDGELEQPLPKIHWLKSLAAVALERVVGGEVAAQQLAAADLGQALEPGEVRARLGELRRVVEVRTDDLRRAQFAVFHLTQMDKVRAGFAGLKRRIVAAGGCLLERDELAFALWPDDDGLQVEEVAIVAVGVHRLDADDAAALLDGDVRREVAGLDAAQAPVG